MKGLRRPGIKEWTSTAVNLQLELMNFEILTIAAYATARGRELTVVNTFDVFYVKGDAADFVGYIACLVRLEATEAGKILCGTWAGP
jgi:hypothetical protein